VVTGVGGLTRVGALAAFFAMGVRATIRGPTVVNVESYESDTAVRFPITTPDDHNTNSATFDLNGVNQQVGSLSGTGSLTLGSALFTVGDTTSTSSPAPSAEQSGKVTKVGSGTLTLSGANTYAGVTTINGGVLSVNSVANVGAANSASVPRRQWPTAPSPSA